MAAEQSKTCDLILVEGDVVDGTGMLPPMSRCVTTGLWRSAA